MGTTPSFLLTCHSKTENYENNADPDYPEFVGSPASPCLRNLKKEWTVQWKGSYTPPYPYPQSESETEDLQLEREPDTDTSRFMWNCSSLDTDDHRRPLFGDYFNEVQADVNRGCCCNLPKDIIRQKELALAEEGVNVLALTKTDDLECGEISSSPKSELRKRSRSSSSSLEEGELRDSTGNSDEEEDEEVKHKEKLKRRRLRFGTLKDQDLTKNLALEEKIIKKAREIERLKSRGFSLVGDPLENRLGFIFRPKDNNNIVDSNKLTLNDIQIELREKRKNRLESRGLVTRGGKCSKFRPIVVDGSNVAFSYGEVIKKERRFCPKGIHVCVNHFTALGCSEIYVVVPEGKLYDESIEDAHILEELHGKGILLTSWSHQLMNGKWISSYDDRMILNLATKRDGIIISNDRFRDLWLENTEWHNTINKRVIGFRFLPGIENEITFPTDPFGRYGPSLTEVLHF